jgi:hypothetical protein
MTETPIELIARLARENNDQVTAWAEKLRPVDRRGLFIEICRALDYEQIRQLEPRMKHALPYQEFDLMLRGWNQTVVQMLTPDFHEIGIPSRTSDSESLRLARSILYQLGLSSLLRKTVDMVAHGMASLEMRGESIHVQSHRFGSSDHFLDQVDMLAKTQSHSNSVSGPITIERVRELMVGLVFPWEIGGVNMVGYGAAPEIDAYYLSVTADQLLEWRNEAGIHPDIDVCGTSGSLLTAITGLLAGVYLKHMHFVGVGQSKINNVNIPMSLTLWEPKANLVKAITSFIDGKESDVVAALDRLIVKPENTRYFAVAERPYVPMLIQVSDVHVLRPLASIFRNPLHNARMLMEFETPEIEITVREPREAWMRNELYQLFSGSGCRMLGKAVILKHKGSALTDVDAALHDPATGCLGLFQLKWQDFGHAEVRKQKSKAKNFVSQVDQWTEKIESLTAEVGLDGLSRLLHLGNSVSSLFLFAIGRFSARFHSYGYFQSSSRVAVCTWPQLSRLRKQLTSDVNILQTLHSAISAERNRIIDAKPMPYETRMDGQRIVFENIWNTFDDDEPSE